MRLATEPMLSNLPSIVAFRLADCPRDISEGVSATMTIEHGPWVLAGMRLCQNPRGLFFLKPPRTRNSSDRLVLRSGPERDLILSKAIATLLALEPHRTAAPPLATAPELEPSE